MDLLNKKILMSDRNASPKDIAKRLGVSRNTIYTVAPCSVEGLYGPA